MVAGVLSLVVSGCEKRVDIEKIVHIEVEQSYGEAQHVILPFKEWTIQTLDAAGFQSFYRALEGGRLFIRAEGLALSADYQLLLGELFPKYTLYTGAIVEGTVTLEAQGRTLAKSFSETISPPKITHSFPESPDGAPFKEATEASFKSVLLEIVVGIRGSTEPIVVALRDKDRGVRVAAARVLGKIRDPLAVEPLIKALSDEDVDVRRAVTQALVEIADPRAVRPLVRALKDEPWNASWAVYSILEDVDPRWRETEEAKRTIPELIDALKNPGEDFREMAA